MFKKPPTLATRTSCKSSDRRRLQQELSENFAVPLDEAKSLLGDDVKQSKGSTSAGEHFTLFTGGANAGPVLFRLGKGEQGVLVPALYTIWESSSNLSLPVLVTNDMVLEKLVGGADLMLPGVSERSVRDLPETLPEGAIVGIGTLSLPGAVRAVGRLTSSAAALKKARGGKAVEVLHVEGDCLWSLGDGSRAQAKEAAQSSTTEASEPGDETNEPALISVEPAPGDSGDAPSELAQHEVDILLHEALLYAISQVFAKQSTSFPLSSSKFMDTVLSSRRASSLPHEVGIKKSSFKNASAFLKQAKKDGLVSTKEAKGGEVSVVGVSTSHAEVKAFKPYKTAADAQKQERKREAREEEASSKATQRSIAVVELYKPHGSTLALCETLGFGKDSLVLPIELRNALNEYLVAQELINPHDHSYISLNSVLSSALLKKGEQLDFMPRSEVLDRLLKAMQAWHRLTTTSGGASEELTAKGTMKKVSVAVKKRQGKKLVTIVEGLEPFLVSPQKLAEDLQIKCASSSTTNDLPGSTPKKPLQEVVVQGNQTVLVLKELTEVWGVPKNWVEVHKP